MLRLLARVGGLIAVSLLLILAARLIGGRNANPAAALLGAYLNPVPQGCWHEICVMTTDLKATEKLLMNDPAVSNIQVLVSDICWDIDLNIRWHGCMGSQSQGQDPLLEYIQLTPLDHTVQLGDVIALFGQPAFGDICWVHFPDASNRPVVRPSITFQNGITVSGDRSYNLKKWGFTPQMILYYINIQPPFTPRDSDPRWHGFRPNSALPVFCHR